MGEKGHSNMYIHFLDEKIGAKGTSGFQQHTEHWQIQT